MAQYTILCLLGLQNSNKSIYESTLIHLIYMYLDKSLYEGGVLNEVSLIL